MKQPSGYYSVIRFVTLSQRRRREPVTGAEVYEVKLGEEFLMSSLFTVEEEELARLALARPDGSALRVVVGGLGLGYAAQAVLEDDRVAELVVVDLLEAVIAWHQQGLVPIGPALEADPRCRLVHGDFFAMAAAAGFDPRDPQAEADAILVDIDHSPQHKLAEESSNFYSYEGTRKLAVHLRRGGVDRRRNTARPGRQKWPNSGNLVTTRGRPGALAASDICEGKGAKFVIVLTHRAEPPPELFPVSRTATDQPTVTNLMAEYS